MFPSVLDVFTSCFSNFKKFPTIYDFAIYDVLTVPINRKKRGTTVFGVFCVIFLLGKETSPKIEYSFALKYSHYSHEIIREQLFASREFANNGPP